MQQVIDHMWAEASKVLFITKEEFVRDLAAWEIEPVEIDGVLAFATLRQGPHFHFHSFGTGRRLTRKMIEDFLTPIIKTYGYAATKTPKDDERQQRFDAGDLPDFLPETRHIREADWEVARIPADLLDRRVEITGPVDRKMIVNALNSGARVFMADFEDATSPTWANQIEGQINLKDRWAGKIDFTDDTTGKAYRLSPNPAVLLVRPRGWHLPEEHLVIDGQPMSGALFDFGLYFFLNARTALERGSGPYFYLPKMESHLEARLWNEVFSEAEHVVGIRNGAIKATVLIETLPAAFEMDEIIYELRDHMAGLNCGRWDYIFSFIKTLRNKPEFLLPDRGQVVMGKAFLKAYSELLVKTCHRRGAFAMGGMAAQIPDRKNPAVNEAAFAKVRADKEREARAGHDGTWVAHPDLVPVAGRINLRRNARM